MEQIFDFYCTALTQKTFYCKFVADSSTASLEPMYPHQIKLAFFWGKIELPITTVQHAIGQNIYTDLHL